MDIPGFTPAEGRAAGAGAPEADGPADDLLRELLATLEPSSQLYFRAELGHPFSIAVPEAAGVIRFHVVAEGPCTLTLEGREPVSCAPGDLVLVPHGAAHVLSDAPARTPRALAAVLEESGFDGSGPLRSGDAGADGSVLVCGHFAFSPALLHPLVASLPPLLHVRAGETRGYGWMAQVLGHIERETRLRRPGHAEVTRRLSEVLLIEALRAHADREGPAALSALADPRFGRVLRAIQAQPEADWSLETLARLAGQSRTLFAERFRERVGMPPMTYLAAWRMHTARGLLRQAGLPMAEVARRVGYASESAFSRSFRAHFGTPPGAWRRAHT
jgi:AraC-like DNA-binding protein